MAKKKEFKKGDIVRFTRKFLKSIGSVTGPINGIVLGKSGTWVSVQWSDADEPVLVHPVNLELDPRHKKKNPAYRASCAPKAGKLTAAKERRLPDKAYGLTKERKYPMPDASHARNAKARASAEYKRGNLTRKQYAQIQRKANRIIKGCGGDPAPVKNPKTLYAYWPATASDEQYFERLAKEQRWTIREIPISSTIEWKTARGAKKRSVTQGYGYLLDTHGRVPIPSAGFSMQEWGLAGYLLKGGRFYEAREGQRYADSPVHGKPPIVNPKRKKAKRRVKKRAKPKVSVTVSRSVTVTQNPDRLIAAWSRI